MKFPKVKVKKLTGRNAYNKVGLVVMDSDLLAKPHPNYFSAILAQECWESRFKTWIITSLLKLLFKSVHRYMEINGHEVEVQAAVLLYGASEGDYRLKEATTMANGDSYGKIFKGMTPSDIARKMQAKSSKARKWVKKHEDFLRSHMTK